LLLEKLCGILYKGKSLHLAAGLSFSWVSSRQFLSGMQKLQISYTNL